MDVTLISDSMNMSHIKSSQDQNNLGLWKSQMGLMLAFYGSIALMILGTFLVNHKLFDTIRKETHNDAGKVLQWIMKTYALIQTICWPIIALFWVIFVEVAFAYDNLLNPCVVIYIVHIMVPCFIFVRAYVGLNSLVLAFGRYAFVVHHNSILKFGQIRLGKILKTLSFIIPLFTTILGSSVIPVKYKGWFSIFKKYDDLCLLMYNNQDQANITNDLYTSPIYNLAHSFLPPLAVYCIYLVFVTTSIIFYSNVTEGIIYIKSAMFVIR